MNSAPPRLGSSIPCATCFHEQVFQGARARRARTGAPPSGGAGETWNGPPSAAPEAFSPSALPARQLPNAIASSLDEHLVSLLAPKSREAEQYRALRYLIEQLHKSTDLSVIAVSSPAVADGKTTTAINLAGALAQAPDARVLLIDADLRVPSLARQLGFDADPGPGLVEAILNGNFTLDAVTRNASQLNLSVVTTGRIPAAPYEVLKSPRLAELLAEGAADTTTSFSIRRPWSSADCRIIGRLVDGFLIVVTAHKTPRELLEEALTITEQAKVLGLVFNGDDHHVSRGYSYGMPLSDPYRGGWRRRVFGSGTRSRDTASHQ